MNANDAGLTAVTRPAWTVLKMAAFPAIATAVTHALTGSDMWAALALGVAVLVECVLSACARSSQISEMEDGR